jgi:serine/threonine protein phosphatase PrpC
MMHSKPLRLHVAAFTHTGLRRQSHEDCIAIGTRIVHEPMQAPSISTHTLTEPCSCVVADGMGGHPAGDVASRAALEHFGSGLAAAFRDDAMLIALLRDTNRTLFDAMSRHPRLYGMGTTIAGIAVDNEEVATFNVGDSRVYRCHRGRIEQLSLDHSEEVATNLFFSQPHVRVLNQCLGGFPGNGDLTPHVVRLPATEAAQYLICSDGLHDMLSDEAIHDCLEDEPSRSVSALFEAAMSEGGADNISIILARIEAVPS